MTESPRRLLRVLDNLTIGAVVMTLFTGFVWGCGATAIMLSRVSCLVGMK
jgi:hypothetical protein